MRGKIKGKWTPEEDKFLSENFTCYTYPELGKLMGRPDHSLQNRLRRLGLRLPVNIMEERKRIGWFVKGNIPFNRGRKGTHFSPATEFKKGNIPGNTKYDGAIAIRHSHFKRGGPPYKWIRVSKAKWKMLHVYNWEKANGKVPSGYIVVFKDKDTMNCDIQNLELITREEHLLRNSGNFNLDAFIAAQMSHRQPELRKILRSLPEVIEIKRQQNKLIKELKNATREKVG